MNYRMIIKSLGTVLFIEAGCLLLSLFVDLIYGGEDTSAFLITILLAVAVGFLMSRVRTPNINIYARDGFAIVSLGWLLISFFGALPFYFSGVTPSLTDAFFESVSGFSTTGATIFREVEGLPEGILFWRSFTHWLGGMGVLVLTLAVLPSVRASTVHIMKAESPGPAPEKLVPKIGQTAKILYLIYIVLTAIMVVFLLIAGMPLYDSLIHSFGTAGTGGFSNRNLSIGAYDNVFIDIIITFFMLIFGVNFSLHYQIIKGNIKSLLRDEEFRFYIGIVVLSTLMITIDLYGKVYHSIWEGLRHSAFQVSSIITTTGYATADFNLWPVFSKCILMILMFVGASAGSTGGGIKCIRILLLFKIIKREIARIIHPRSVYTVKIAGRTVEESTLSQIMAYFFTFMLIFVVAMLVVALDGKDLVTTFTSVAATMGNVGPGLEMVGPMSNFADFSALSKLVLSMCMIIGRLEIFPILILFTPTFWKRVNI